MPRLVFLSVGILALFGLILGFRLGSSGALQTFYLFSTAPALLLASVFVLDKLRSSISLLIPLVFSLLLSVFGLGFGLGSIIARRRSGERVGKLVASTLLAAIPIFYAIVRKLP